MDAVVARCAAITFLKDAGSGHVPIPTYVKIGADLMVEASRRRVQLVAVSSRHTPDELLKRFGMRGDATFRTSGKSQAVSPDEYTWELHENGTSSSDVSDLLASLHARAQPITEQLNALKDEGGKVILRVILYLSPNDEQGT